MPTTPSRESTPASSKGDENFEINKFIELVDIKNLDYEDFVVDDDACPHCFWFPCVATLRPNWLGQGCTPMDGNNIIRKDRSVKQLMGSWSLWTGGGCILFNECLLLMQLEFLLNFGVFMIRSHTNWLTYDV